MKYGSNVMQSYTPTRSKNVNTEVGKITVKDLQGLGMV